jgi:hypothetical protein
MKIDHGKFFQTLKALSFFYSNENIVSMIHNSSTDPVLIKKISLKIWTLRDEIEARIKSEIGKNPEVELDVNSIKASFQKSVSNNVVELKTGAELDTSEDEMARAMRGEEEATEATEATENSTQDSENNVVQLNANQNTIEVTLEVPEIEIEKISKGKTVLSEINMEKMFFFCNQNFTEGQSIVIQFCIPKMFILNADVLYCRPYNLKSRIISQNNYNYRMLVKFTFLKDGERALLRQFIQSIEPEFQKIDKKANSSGESNEDSGFGELDDLGL